MVINITRFYVLAYFIIKTSSEIELYVSQNERRGTRQISKYSSYMALIGFSILLLFLHKLYGTKQHTVNIDLTRYIFRYSTRFEVTKQLCSIARL